MTRGLPGPIAVNATMVGERPTGLGYYAVHVVGALQRLGERQIVFTSHPEALGDADVPVRLVPAAVRPERGGLGHAARLAWLQTGYRARLRPERVHALLNLAPEGLLAPSRPQVTTVFDLVPLLYPREYPRHYRYFRHWLPRLLRHSRAIVVISESTRRDLLHFYDVPPERVHVALCGYDAWRFSPDGGEGEASTEPYALCVGNVMPHKNLLRLVDAFALVASRVPGKLVLCGSGRDPHERALRERIALRRLETHVDWRDWVSEPELARLYRGARMLVLPSLHEGFGLTALEAMASGTPVVASDRSAPPEVVGDAALLVDPLEPEAIADAMLRVFTDDRLAKELAGRGRVRAALFSWECTARAIASAVEAACGA